MSDSGNDRSSNGNRDNSERPFKNIKGLLKFCVEATKSEDAQGSQEGLEPMSEERRKWLEEALTSMTVSPVERLRACLSLIEGSEVDSSNGTEQQITALSELEEWVEDLDIAEDFIKLNGLRVLPGLLSSEVSELRWRGLELLANLSQNNPKAQKAILSVQLLPVMIHMVNTDPNPTARTKALYAVSCLVRGSGEAERELLTCEGGLQAIVKCLHSDVEKLKLKATFLISTLCSSNPAFKDFFTQQGAVEQLVLLLKEDPHNSVHEHIMSALLAVVRDNAQARTLCLDQSWDLKTFLCHRIRELQGREEFLEEREYAEQVLSILNSSPTSPSHSSSTSNSMALMLA